VLMDSESNSAERAEAVALVAEARARIGTTFGASRNKAPVIFLSRTDGIWPLNLNDYASTGFLGPLSCVIVGPKGRGVDVLAHELMHAEIFERIGFFRRLTNWPTWFDEGLAMQVDFRPRYDLQPALETSTRGVRDLRTPKAFFAGSDEELTNHYRFAKHEVRQLIERIGKDSLFMKLENPDQQWLLDLQDQP
jgi:hypothetical protein